MLKESYQLFQRFVRLQPIPRHISVTWQEAVRIVRVPYREITLSDTRHGDHAEANPPLPVYDTSGPYTDPEIEIALDSGSACPAE